MFRPALVAAVVLALVATSQAVNPLAAGQAQPRQPPPQRESQPPNDAPPKRAQPRPETPPQREAPPPRREADPRRRPAPAPPPRVIPPHYNGVPRPYYFPPISLQRGYYYHPYFGFYYGPYYGPYYPFPGPFFGPARLSASAVRTKVRPVDTEIYLNGYFAGIADDFDGLFQRLYLPSGEHVIELHLPGYRTFRQPFYVGPGDTFEIAHEMRPLPPGTPTEPVSPPRALLDEWAAVAPDVAGDRPASPFGILAVRIAPPDAEVLVDGEVWAGLANQPELVIHLSAGWHTLEIRSTGYQSFKTTVNLSEGATTKMEVRLEKQ